MSFIKRLFPILLFVFSSASAQDGFVGYWQPQLALNYKVSDNYSHNFLATQRNYIYQNDDLQLKVRQMDIGHFSQLKIRDNQSIGLGALYRFRKTFEEEEDNEIRFIQQYNITNRLRNIRFGHRLRSEQRITSSLTTHRFRYRFAMDSPLQGEKLDVGESYFVGTLESLLSVANSTLPQYDQRFTISLGWLLTKNSKFQTGVEYRFEDFTHKTENVFFLHSSLILNL